MTEDDLPIEHLRRPVLPWQTDRNLTECGRDVAGLTVITREECIAKIKKQGKQRAAFTTCMTCASTSDRWPSWDVDPVRAVARQVDGWKPDPALRDELFALAALVAAHRGEFDEYLAGLGDTVRLDEKRRERRRAGARRR